MKYGDIVKGKCNFCDCENFYFLGRKRESFLEDLLPVTYLEVICLGCKFVQWIEE